MNLLGEHIASEVLYVIGIILGVLVLCTLAFSIFYQRKRSEFSKELLTRTVSWWKIASGFFVVLLSPPIVGTLIIAYVSFVALREMLSIGMFRESDRSALFASYLAIPIQYYFAYKGMLIEFLTFIPLVTFIVLPFILVLKGFTERIGRSMSLIPSTLILTVYMISYVVMLYSAPIKDHPAGHSGLILFLVMTTAFNDVFQYTWGKLIGKHKILPLVSPNKTWEGFLGGICTTAGLAFAIRFLTPLSGTQAIIAGLIIGVVGFVGDSLISGIKRDLGLKDTDNVIPGHGGAMDRLDSILFTSPIFFHLLLKMAGT